MWATLVATLLAAACGAQPAADRAERERPDYAGPVRTAKAQADATPAAVAAPEAAPPQPVATAAPARAAAAAPAPGTCALTPTRGREVIALGSRTYELLVPASLGSLPPGTRVPLMLGIHGLGGTGRGYANLFGWDAYADSKRFIAVYPDGLNRAWNTNPDSPDIAFAREIVADVSAKQCVDPRRVHTAGHSNGAMFAQRLACSASDVFASATEFAGPAPFGACVPPRGVAVALFHGDRDTVVTPQQGRGARDAWVRADRCDATPQTDPSAQGESERYRSCRDGVEVTWRLYTGLGHSPEEPWLSDYRDRTWDWFARFGLPA